MPDTEHRCGTKVYCWAKTGPASINVPETNEKSAFFRMSFTPDSSHAMCVRRHHSHSHAFSARRCCHGFGGRIRPQRGGFRRDRAKTGVNGSTRVRDSLATGAWSPYPVGPSALQVCRCPQVTTSRGCSMTGAAATEAPSIACCRSSMPNCGGSPRASFAASGRDTRCNPQRWCTRRTCGWFEQRDVDWQNRAHFFGVAAQVMRRILVDHARRQVARKRGDGAQRVPLEEIRIITPAIEFRSLRWIAL